jgi:2-aminoadipate transaminase
MFSILKDKDIISFAGGFPNPALFPIKAFEEASQKTLKEAPREALQYGETDGLYELRAIIAHSYEKKDGILISPERVLITNGSQQGLDLLGKVLVNEGDTVLVENPTYLAAIQALSLYAPTFSAVPLDENGPHIPTLTKLLKETHPVFFYTIPNFQNPTGLSYSEDTRKKVVAAVRENGTLLIEDDPYGEIRFEGERKTPFAGLHDGAILLGSFSKIVAPGLRLGWVVAPNEEFFLKLHTAKQAADLHTSTFVQHVVYRYYRDNDTDAHIKKIAAAYKQQKDTMLAALREHLPDGISYTNPEGGMFLWATFPEHVDTAKLFAFAIEEKVAFVPGESFFAADAPKNTMRLNYSNSTIEQTKEGVRRLAKAFARYSAS